MPKRPCLVCGTPTDGSRCPDHNKSERTSRFRPDTGTTAWINLSKRARRAQPWCLLCGATTDLQVDHSPRAWARIAERKLVRLYDVSVLCRHCNLAAGSSKPGTDRYNVWLNSDGQIRARTPDPTLRVSEAWGVGVESALPAFEASPSSQFTPPKVVGDD